MRVTTRHGGRRRLGPALAALLLLPAVTTPAHACIGDCNADAVITVDEILRGVAIAIGEADRAACPAFDADADGAVTVDEIVAAVRAALAGCLPVDCDLQPIEAVPRCCATAPAPATELPSPRCGIEPQLLLGRNSDGFGRIDPCEVVPLLQFAQGGVALRLHVWAACLDAAAPIRIDVSLRTADESLLDVTRFARFQIRGDGWREERSLVFELPFPTEPDQYEGVEAELRLQVTDVSGTTGATTTTRVVLTMEPVPDEPDPN